MRYQCLLHLQPLTNATADLSIWRIYEINLTSGEHIISMEGLNDGAQAAFGAEIYSATTAQLTGMTTESQLSAVTIFYYGGL